MAKLGSFIRRLRQERGMTQAELAKLLYVTDKAVSKWERELSYPDVSLFPKLADVLGVTVSDLLREGDDEAAPLRFTRYYQRSRDIRTPIHIIIGCADLLEQYGDDPEKRSRYLEAIRTSGRFLLDRLEQGAQPAKTDGVLTAERPKLPAYDFRGKRILIAEDMELNREIAREIVGRTGAEVEFAENGAVCLEMVEQAPAGYFDMILMDITMPIMGGIEATKRIRRLEDRKKAAVPIVAMTANVGEWDRKTAFDAGMDGFTEKPIHIEKLYATMKKLL